MATHIFRWRHLALLISILLVFIVTPFAVTFRQGILVLNIVAAILLVAGSYALSERKHVLGQIYLAVLVARLVGLHIVHATGLGSGEKE